MFLLHPTFPPFTPYCYSCLSTATQAVTYRKDKAQEGLNPPNQSFLFLSFLLCLSGTIFILSCWVVYSVALKQTFTPFWFDRRSSGSKYKSYNCHNRSFGYLDRQWPQALVDYGQRGKRTVWTWEGTACLTNRLLWQILSAQRNGEGKASQCI